MEARGRHLPQGIIVTHEDGRERPAQELGQDLHDDRQHQDHFDAHFEHALQPGLVVRAILIAEDGGRPHGEADEGRGKDEVDVHHDGIGRHALLPRRRHELAVIQHCHQRGGDVRHQFGDAVGAALAQHPQVWFRLHQAQGTFVLAQKVEQGDQAADNIAAHRRSRRPRHAPAEEGDEHIVQEHIGHARADGQPQAHLGPLGHHEEALAAGLQQEDGGARQHDRPVGDAVAHQSIVGTQDAQQGLLEQQTGPGQDRAAHHNRDDQIRKIFFRQLVLPQATGLGDLCAAARAQHEAKGPHDHHQRIDDVHRRQRLVAHQVRDEQPVHHGVDGRDQHHHDGWQGEAEEPGKVKPVRELDRHLRSLCGRPGPPLPP